MIREYRSISQIKWPLMTVCGVQGIACGEAAELELPDGDTRACLVLEIREGAAVLLLTGRPEGIRLHGSCVRFLGRGPELGVSEDLLGRVFSAMGMPADGGPDVIAEAQRSLDGLPCSPCDRRCPAEAVAGNEHSLSAAPLLYGEVRPVLAGAGLSSDFAAALVENAMRSDTAAETALVYAGIGGTAQTQESFVQRFRRAGLSDRTVLFVSTAEASAAERLAIPKLAMTAAEYLAFDRGMRVFVILDDMAAYADALRELAAARRAAVDGDGYPLTLCDNVAALYERAGLRRGCEGSVTLLPVLPVPETHPLAVLTASLTEKRTVLYPMPYAENGGTC